MRTTTKLALGALAVLVLGFAVFRGLTEKDDQKGAEDAVTANKASQAKPTRASAEASDSATPSPEPATIDDDPVGNLRMEGQVLDEEDNPVGGATVMLGSSPPKTATSEEDGSFFFEDLVSRRYAVYARSTDRVGGPVVVTLSEGTDPVVVRVQAGGGLEVEVVDEDDKPVSGATVSLPSHESIHQQTDGQGLARLANLPHGQTYVTAQAPGFAKSGSLANVPKGAEAVGRQRIQLQRGYKVSGTVFDHRGEPVAEAKIIYTTVGSFIQSQSLEEDAASSDSKGHFELAAVPAGSTQLFAHHDEHASASSERFSVSEGEVSNIEIHLREGASIAGRVVTTAGEPVPWATVRVLSPADKQNRGSGVNRQRIAEEDGRFELKGLPRQEVLVHASSETASSQGVAVNLEQQAKAKDLQIVLDIEGMISGVVVDEKGEPIAEAQVQAYPDFWEGGDIDQLRVRGPAFATTKGDGAFVIRGLPDSKFRVIASRGMLSGGSQGRAQGTPATTGDDNVRVVIASPGNIVGQVELTSGGAPSLATVSIGWGAGVPTANGDFRLSDVPPGVYEVAVRGPDFAATFQSKVEVKSGEETDLGTITVKPGRAVSGRVVNGAGQAVADAEVILAKQLISDGGSLSPKDLGETMESYNGTRRVQTDETGAFRLRGIGEGEWTIAAEHSQGGRSIGQKIPAGLEDLELDLGLLPVGSVRGTVKLNGEAASGVQVLITSTASEAQHIVVVSSDDRGAFFAERVSAGEHKVSAMLGNGANTSMAATLVTIEAGEESEANLSIEEGSVTLEVSIRGEKDATIDAAQVFLFKGVAKVSTGSELNKLFLNAASSAKMVFAFGSGKAKFEKVNPATYSICVIPINGDMNDPAFAQKLQRHVSDIAVHCFTHEVAEVPENQSYNAVVPPMQPLPED